MADWEKDEVGEEDMNEIGKMDLKRSSSNSTNDAEAVDHQSLPLQPPSLEPTDLVAISALVHTVAQKRQGQSLELLALLRLLEGLHQEIRDSLFQKSLPDNRQALYALLRDIEADGGWPYIHRMKLQEFLANLALQLAEESPKPE